MAHCGAMFHPKSCDCPPEASSPVRGSADQTPVALPIAPAIPVATAAATAVTPLVESINTRLEEDRDERVAEDVARLSDDEPPVAKPRRTARAPWNPLPVANAKSEEELLYEQILEAVADPGRRVLLLAQLNGALARQDFAEFCRQAWPVIEPATKLEWSWHHTLIANTLQALFESWQRAGTDETYVPPVLNTVFSVAPGSLKSKLVLVLFPAWCWLHAPGAKFICLSVNEDATLRDARGARDVICSDWYQTTFQPDWKLKLDQVAVSNYGNTVGGVRLSKPSGSAIVGLRGDFLLYDDPNSPDENQAERDLVNQIWDASIYSRVNSGVRSLRIGIQQRVGGGDWTDHVLKTQKHWSPDRRDGWLNVVLPAEYEAERRFVMPEELASLIRDKLDTKTLVLADPRTVEGESIHPSRFSVEYLASERRRFEGTGNYASQYQQRPALVGGNLVKRRYFSWFRLDGGVRPEFDEVPKGRPRPAECVGDTVLVKARHNHPGHWDFDWLVISLDCAAKKTTKGSNWGMVAIAGKDGRRYVLDDRTRRGDILEIVEVLRAMIRMWKPDKILIEDKAAGEDLRLRLLGEMQKGDMPMVILEPVKVGSAGKEERLSSCLPAIANGMLFLLDGAPWLEEFVEELAVFPNGQRDDRIDCVSQCLNHYYEPAEEDGGMPGW